jgi:antitoxin (DNA-binding transcriptional repressor) of toxin-antitoxin stability system
MPRFTVSQAERDFVNLVNRVHTEGISVELARGDQVIARLVPAGPRSALKIQDLNTFLRKDFPSWATMPLDSARMSAPFVAIFPQRLTRGIDG